jgi:hypothetical protein
MRKPATQRWLAMGVEMEGGWNKDIHAIARDISGSNVKTDGSIRVPGVNYLQEVTTRPHKTMASLLGEIEKMHPEVANETCGYHIHTSFSIPDYMSLMDKAFWGYYLEHWDQWFTDNKADMSRDEAARFSDRFHGKRLPGTNSNFCRREFIPEKQIRDGSDRYTQLNFSAWHRYKTIECRMLPMFVNAKLTTKATTFLGVIYDSFLGSFNPEGIFADETQDYVFDGPDGSVIVEERVVFQRDSGWETEAPTARLPRVITGKNIEYKWLQARVRTDDRWGEDDEMVESL